MSPDLPRDAEHQPLPSTPFSLGPWRVQPSRNLLTWTEGDVQVTPKCMEVLCLLAEADGEVVSRQHLLQVVWPGTVVNEEVLTRVISDLRRALGDERSRPRFIETIPKRGYRLVAEVQRAPGPVVSVSVTDDQRNAVIPSRRNHARGWWRLVGVMLVLGLGFVVIRSALRTIADDEAAPSGLLATMPLTSDPGLDAFPAFAPDGTRVAFSRRAAAIDHYHVFVKQPNQARELQLTEGPADDVYPTWSPDGGTIAFVRSQGNGRSICTIPSLGGPVQEVVRLEGIIRGLDWSPDGTTLAFGFAPSHGVFSVQTLTLACGSIQTLVPHVEGTWGDRTPRFSPSGDRVAFIRSVLWSGTAVGIVDTKGGPVTTIDHDLERLSDLDWYPDGRHLVVSALTRGQRRVWKMSVETSYLVTLALPADQVLGLSLCPATGALAVHVPQFDVDLKQYSLNDGGGVDHELPGEYVLRSTQADYLPAMDPVGSRIAFCSDRTGESQIYLAETVAHEPRALTSYHGVNVLSLEWSPDGKQLLVFGETLVDSAFVALLDPASGQERQLPLPWQEYDSLKWSADGEWIHFNSCNDDTCRAYKMRPDGSDARVVCGDHGVRMVQEDASDGSLYYLVHFQHGLFRLNADGTKEYMAEFPPLIELSSMGSQGHRIHYVEYRDKRSVLLAFDLTTGWTDTLGTLSPRCSGPLALHRDGDSLLVTTSIYAASNLILVPHIP